MVHYLELRDSALKNLKIADHMLNVTYPLVKDPKLFISIIDHIFLSLVNAITALLYYEQRYKKLFHFKDNFTEKYDVFARYCARHYKINQDYLTFILNIKSLVLAHQKSNVEFVRKEKIVICDAVYSYKTIDATTLKTYVDKTRMFVYLIHNLLHSEEKAAKKHLTSNILIY